VQAQTDFTSLISLLNSCKGKQFVLCDEHTFVHCYPKFSSLIGQQISPIVIKTGEAHKNLATCEIIWHNLLNDGADKNTLLINLGGGVVTDIGGFAAATYKRGINYVNVPTSLLAMVDAATGGKTGVNFSHFKNMIGVIYAAQMVVIYVPFLETLSQQHLKNGFAEMLKHSLIASEEQLQEYLSLGDISEAYHEKAILKSLEIKENTVKQDPTEKGLRKVLNFGHTVGHAIEYAAQLNEYDILHGEAVAIGMIVALKLSVNKMNFDAEKAAEIIRFIEKNYQTPTWLNSCQADILKAILQDKKNSEQEIKMVLLAQIGKPVYDVSCSIEEIAAILLKI